jgi:uncharacterized protein (DUF2267 family)
MTLNFDKYAQSGHAFVKKIARELGDENDTSTASRILRSTLIVLRDQSTPEEAMQFISQLPMLIKALYVDGWKLSDKKSKVRHLDDFITEVHKQSQAAGHDDFTSQEGCFLAIQAVFRVIREYVSAGEIEDLRLTLPVELRPLLDL